MSAKEEAKENLAEDVASARRRFDEACDRLRPDLHRFCTRMTGSPCDGEDVLQDALVHAFYRLTELREPGALRAWLFRIAHNKCIDFLRVRQRFDALAEPDAEEETLVDEELDRRVRAERTLSNIVTSLPPKERACVILKDILDCSLEETAEITGSNAGAVKSALHRAREKLEHAERTPQVIPIEPRLRALVERYVVAFNRRDWDGVRALLADDARLQVVNVVERPFADDCYFVNYGRLAGTWKFALAAVDGVESIVQFREVNGAWAPHSVVVLRAEGDRISLVRDYNHVCYLLRHATVVPLQD